MQEMFLKNKLATLSTELQQTYTKLLCRSRWSVCAIAQPEQQASIAKRLSLLIKTFETTCPTFDKPIQIMNSHAASKLDTVKALKKDFYIIPGHASFVIESFEAPAFNHPESPSLEVAGCLKSTFNF